MKIIENKDKSKYIEELLKYGDPPDLEELQCLNLLIDVLQPELVQQVIDKERQQYNEVNAFHNLIKLTDSELRDRTIRDSGLILMTINKIEPLKQAIPWFWVKIYLPRYKKYKRKNIPKVILNRNISNLLKNTRKHLKDLPKKHICKTCQFYDNKQQFYWCKGHACSYKKINNENIV